MVLTDLGRRLTSALSSLSSASEVDEALVDDVLKEITSALLESDVNVKLVGTLRNRVKAKVVPLLSSKGSTNVRNSLQRAVVDELVALVDPTDGSGASTYTTWKPKKKAANVIMFVGLQGSGKTTSCTKLAVHYQRRGFKTCLVCADTFRAGAFDQLKQNAAKARIPFFGSYTETDPVVISGQGVEKFKAERFEVIIVDTSGRHRQEVELFDEMKQISAAVKPDLTIMVLDGAIGQAAESQSKAFKEAAGFGAIIVTKMDGHARGGGAISAVAATKTPIMFIGTGEHIHDLERFEPRPFISKLLGMGDIGGLMERAREVGMSDPQKQEDMRKKIEAGVFSIRDMRDQFVNISKLGPLSNVASMLPGGMGQMLSGMGGSDEEASAMFRKMICISDAMTTEELDSDGKIFEPLPRPEGAKPLAQMQAREPNPRVLRVARGSGTSVDMVEQLLAQHRTFSSVVKRMGGKSGLASAMGGAGRGRGGGMPGAAQMAAMQNMLPPHLRGPGGMAQLQQMAQQMGMGGGGAGGGMPDMGAMQRMMASMGMQAPR